MIRIQISRCIICKTSADAIVPAGKQTIDLLCDPCADNSSMVFVGDGSKVSVVWEYWRAGYERSFHGQPAVIELGEIG
jgi:hypothetical protein